MARSTQEIYDSIIAEKSNHEELDSLNSESNVAIYKLWAWVTAFAIYVFEVILDNHKQEVEQIANAGAYGTKPWWESAIRKYQHGDILVFNETTNLFEYEAEDLDAQIIKRVSIDDALGIIRIKAAKLTGITVVPLSESELNGLIDYVKDIRPAGTRIAVQSTNADKLKIIGDLYYNASAEIDTIKPLVNAAIIEYINSIPFDGIINRNNLIAAVKSVTGVIDFDVTFLGVKVGSNPYLEIQREFQAVAGYFEIDSEFDLDDTLTYLT